jgi:hypothetical protein
MSEQQGLQAQGFNGVTVSDRTVRHLGVELANSHISLATVNARLEELSEAASHVNFELWEEIQAPPSSEDHEGPVPPPVKSYAIPSYQADAVARLIAMIQRQ